MASTTLENPTSLTTQTFAVEGMTCGGCANGVQRVLSRLNGVSGATVDLASATSTVAYDAATVRPADLQAAVADAGYALKERGTAPSAAPRSQGGGCCCG
jgi:copper chaperone CopZ